MCRICGALRTARLVGPADWRRLKYHLSSIIYHLSSIIYHLSRLNRREEAMRLIAIAFALALASAAQAMPIAPVQQPDSMVTTVREACGAGMHMVNGVCVGTHARRAASRCVRGKTC